MKRITEERPGTRSALMFPKAYVIAGFIQDDWRIRNNLTLNLGLRYDVEIVKDIPDWPAGTDMNNLDPRVGFAWDPKGDQKWAIRGGFGRFTQQHPIFTIVKGGVSGRNGQVTLSLFPGAEGTTTVFFRPPRAAETPTGELPFGIRARSHEDPAGSAVEEGVLVVGAVQDTFAELVPRTSRGSRGATHELAVDNRGNSRLNAPVTAGDQDQLLRFDVEPPGLVVDPGTAGFAKVRVKPRQRFWRA